MFVYTKGKSFFYIDLIALFILLQGYSHHRTVHDDPSHPFQTPQGQK